MKISVFRFDNIDIMLPSSVRSFEAICSCCSFIASLIWALFMVSMDWEPSGKLFHPGRACVCAMCISSQMGWKLSSSADFPFPFWLWEAFPFPLPHQAPIQPQLAIWGSVLRWTILNSGRPAKQLQQNRAASKLCALARSMLISVRSRIVCFVFSTKYVHPLPRL